MKQKLVHLLTCIFNTPQTTFCLARYNGCAGCDLLCIQAYSKITLTPFKKEKINGNLALSQYHHPEEIQKNELKLVLHDYPTLIRGGTLM